MKLSKVETIEIKQGILGRILGYGNVLISVTSSSFVIISKVSNPIEVKKKKNEIDQEITRVYKIF